MASTSITMPTSPASTARKDVFKEHSGLCRSHSGINLCKKAGIRRSYSDNHLCYSVNRIRCESSKPNLKNNRSVGIFSLQISSSIIPDSLKSFLYDPEMNKDLSIADKDVNFDENPVENDEEEKEIKRANWVDRLLEIQRLWKIRQQEESVDGAEICDSENGVCDCDDDGDEVGCVVNYGSEGGGSKEIYDRESFSKLLVQVPWSDTKLFSQLAFLCNMAYVIPELKGKDLKRFYGLEFVTSSVEKKAEVAPIKAKLDQDSTHVPVSATAASKPNFQKPVDSEQQRSSRSSVAYEIAASAASYVQSRTKNLLAPGSKSHHEGHNVGLGKDGDQPEKEGENLPRVYKMEVAAYMAASTMTAVVAAGAKEKQEAARDLQSVHSSPCEWFICDDSSTYTRCFVIQGSDSLASWLANLFFEPTKFEDTDVLVHRGIYEAAKGIYQQFLPEIMDHVKKHGHRAKFQFTGHSLGGSLSLLVNLMLLTRRVVKPSAMRPVVTFGSPFVFCGGQKILKLLGLDESHVHCVMMHRDIVPRAFSCKYPNHVSLFLKRLSSFRTHPCLIKNKLLYSPLGKLFILQPDEKSSPSHPMLPPGNALYVLDKNHYGYSSNALEVFLNCPHPVETLSDPTAYGSEGTILRDHDSNNYLKAINGVLRQHKKVEAGKVLNERTSASPWPLLVSPSPHSWSHDRNSENNRLLNTEVMTGV